MSVCPLIIQEQVGRLYPNFQGSSRAPGLRCKKVGGKVLGTGTENWHFGMLWHPTARCQVSGPRPSTAAAALQAWASEVLVLTTRQYVQQCRMGRARDGAGLKVCI